MRSGQVSKATLPHVLTPRKPAKSRLPAPRASASLPATERGRPSQMLRAPNSAKTRLQGANNRPLFAWETGRELTHAHVDTALRGAKAAARRLEDGLGADSRDLSQEGRTYANHVCVRCRATETPTASLQRVRPMYGPPEGCQRNLGPFLRGSSRL